MRKVKWIFFAYIGVVVLVVVGIGLSFALTPPRDPHTLYAVIPVNLKSLDPAEINDVEADRIVGAINECLYNYKYGVEPYELFPQLATDLPEISPDGLEVTVHVRHGVHYYDPDKYVFPDGVGPEIKAADFVYAWKRVADFHVASPSYTAIFQEKVVGIDDWFRYTQSTPSGKVDYDRPVPGLTTPDPYTIRIKLTQPYPQLRYNLAHLPTAAVCRRVVEKYGEQFRKHPVGSGPYVLAENLPEQRLVMTSNPIYRGRPDADGDAQIPEDQKLPHIKRIQYDYFSEAMPAWLLFQEGLFDVAGVSKDAFKQAINIQTGDLSEAMARKGIRLIKSAEASVYYVGFNMLDPVVGKNKPLRHAMSMALDRKKLIDVFLNGRGQPAIGMIPPGFPTYDPNYKNPYTQFDLDAARAEMKQAEAINGGPIPPLSLFMGDTDTSERQMGDFITSQMAAIGITLNVQYNTWARFQELVDSRQAQLFDLGWVADYPDEQTFLQLAYGKYATPGGINPVVYVNPAYDALYEKASVMNPSPQRDALYRQMQQILMEDCPFIFQFNPVIYTLYYDWVKNFHPMDYGNGMRMNVILDEAERNARRGHQ